MMLIRQTARDNRGKGKRKAWKNLSPANNFVLFNIADTGSHTNMKNRGLTSPANTIRPDPEKVKMDPAAIAKFPPLN